MINRNFKCKTRKVILPFYKSIVRPHLDLLRAGMETALQEGHKQVGEGAEEGDQDGGGSGGV